MKGWSLIVCFVAFCAHDGSSKARGEKAAAWRVKPEP